MLRMRYTCKYQLENRNLVKCSYLHLKLALHTIKMNSVNHANTLEVCFFFTEENIKYQI